MALNFLVTALFAVLFLGSEGQRDLGRRPCKALTQTFNNTGHLLNEHDNGDLRCENGLECPNEWDHPTNSFTSRDESLDPNKIDYTLAFCEAPFCGWFPLCDDDDDFATYLHMRDAQLPLLKIVCRCSDGFRSLQYAGENWYTNGGSKRWYRCETPTCSLNGVCMFDNQENYPNNIIRKFRKKCNCLQGQRCNRLEVRNGKKRYFCRDA